MLIHSDKNQPLLAVREFLESSEEEIIIISPYIRTSTLKELQLATDKNITIITTLKIQDLLMGASDIDLYPYSKDRSINVYINNSIHMKAYIKDWYSCIFGSSNLTGKGMGLANEFNYELNGYVPNLDIKSVIYFKKILYKSVLMNDAMYEAAINGLGKIPDKVKIEEIDFEEVKGNKDYLISSLPMTVDVTKLYSIVSNNYNSNIQEEVDCAIHDSVLFEIIPDVPFNVFTDNLTERFFRLPFIADLLSFIDKKERYFGEVKEWIQTNCEDTPVPSRRDLTGNIQVLYKWIVELSNGKYLVDRPNHSERIYRNNNGK